MLARDELGPAQRAGHWADRPTTNSPSNYQHSKRLRVAPSLDAPPLGFAAASDPVAPDGEALYNNTSATQTTRNNAKADLGPALEAAHAGDGPGQEIAFVRVRFTDSGGLVPRGTYKVTHPARARKPTIAPATLIRPPSARPTPGRWTPGSPS